MGLINNNRGHKFGEKIKKDVSVRVRGLNIAKTHYRKLSKK